MHWTGGEGRRPRQRLLEHPEHPHEENYVPTPPAHVEVDAARIPVRTRLDDNICLPRPDMYSHGIRSALRYITEVLEEAAHGLHRVMRMTVDREGARASEPVRESLDVGHGSYPGRTIQEHGCAEPDLQNGT